MTTGDTVIITVQSQGTNLKGRKGVIISGPSETQLFRVQVEGWGIGLFMRSELEVCSGT